MSVALEAEDQKPLKLKLLASQFPTLSINPGAKRSSKSLKLNRKKSKRLKAESAELVEDSDTHRLANFTKEQKMEQLLKGDEQEKVCELHGVFLIGSG